MKLIVSTFLVYKVKKCLQKSGKVSTYRIPFNKMHHNVSFLVEGAYHFNHDWKVKGAYGMDFGSDQMLGHNAGFQLTVSKSGIFKL